MKPECEALAKLHWIITAQGFNFIFQIVFFCCSLLPALEIWLNSDRKQAKESKLNVASLKLS